MRTFGAVVCILLLSCTLAFVNSQTRTDMPEECRCMGARLQYWELYTDVAGAYLDPVAHALSDASRAWDCSFCNETLMGVPNVYINDTVARCDAAVQNYIVTYNSSSNLLTPANAWDNYWNNFLSSKNVWNAQLCTGAVSIDPRPLLHLTYECTCMAARLDYWNRYSDTLTVDPVAHYLSKWGTGEIRLWNCTPCTAPSDGFEPVYIDQAWSQNCSYAVALYKSGHRDAQNYYNPFIAYYNYFLEASNHNLWHSEVCLNQSTPLPITPAPTPSPTPAPTNAATNPPVTNAPGTTPAPTTPPFNLISTTGDASRAAVFTVLLVFVFSVYLL